MSKQDYVIQILASNEVKDGIIDQSLYDFISESVSTYFDIKISEAKREVSKILKCLYMVGV